MKSVRSEIASACVVLAIPLGIVASFPFGAFGFRAAGDARRPARMAFVALTPEAERQALRAVRASWRPARDGGPRLLRADLLAAELPEEPMHSVLSVRDRSRLPEPPPVRTERTPFLPSQKAPPPSPIAAEDAVVPLPFPREGLLKMN